MTNIEARIRALQDEGFTLVISAYGLGDYAIEVKSALIHVTSGFCPTIDAAIDAAINEARAAVARMRQQGYA